METRIKSGTHYTQKMIFTYHIKITNVKGKITG